MIRSLMKKPTFILGSLYIGFMLLTSFIHQFVFHSYTEQTKYLKDSEGLLIAAPPFAPFENTLLGTDPEGNHLIYLVMMGAKYTILGAIAIAAISLVCAFLIGVVLGFNQDKKWQLIEQLFGVFYFIPASIIAYNLLKPILWEPEGGFTTSLMYRITFEVILISILLMPPAIIFISNETNAILKKDFIVSSKVLGASKLHLFTKHVWPELRFYLVQLSNQLMIQAILITTHLGVFQLFFGGTHVTYSLFTDPPVPIVYDWASIIGNYFRYLQTNAPWLVYVPLILLILFILSVLGITRGIKQVMKFNYDKNNL